MKLLIFVLTSATWTLLPAQSLEQPRPRTCYRAGQLPRCRVFLLTNAGGFVTSNPRQNETPFRALVDWGFMVNTGQRNAFGASWFVTYDQDEFTSGPALRYRRWLAPERSLDIAVGTPLTNDHTGLGSVLGMVKYNPVHWAGIAVRPELVRRELFTCDLSGCVERTVTSSRVYAGLEMGWYPGLTLSVGGGVVIGLLLLALAGSD